LISQLLEILDADGGVASDPRSQRRQFNVCWREAARRATGSGGRQLVLLLDGLDEQDTYGSISRLLPPSTWRNVTVVVSQRTAGMITQTLDDETLHALTTHVTRYRLSRNVHSVAIERDARGSIDEYLSNTDVNRQHIVGFLALGLPFTVDEIAELMDVPVGRVRTLTQRLSRSLFEEEHPRETLQYSFGHAELLRQAKLWFGPNGLKAYMERILQWARSYALEGWPSETPQFLSRYFDDLLPILAPTEKSRYLELFISDERSRLVHTVLGHIAPVMRSLNHYWEMTEVDDVLSCARLAIYETDWAQRTGDAPARLLQAMAEAGRTNEAIELAESITTDAERAAQLSTIGAAAGVDLILDRAFRLLQHSKDREQPQYQSTLARIAGSTRDPALLLAVLDDTQGLEFGSNTYQAASRAALAMGDPHVAVEVAQRVPTSWWGSDVLRLVTLGANNPATLTAIQRIVSELPSDQIRVSGEAAIAAAFRDLQAMIGAVERAELLTGHARDSALSRVAYAMATLDVDAARAVCHRITDPRTRAPALADVSVVAGLSSVSAEAVELARAAAFEPRTLAIVGQKLGRLDLILEAIASAVSRGQETHNLGFMLLGEDALAPAFIATTPLAGEALLIYCESLVGQIDTVLERALSIEPMRRRDSLLSLIVPHLYRVDEALGEQAIESIGGTRALVDALAGSFSLLRKRSLLDRAMFVLAHGSVPELRSRAMILITDGIASKSPGEAADYARQIFDKGSQAWALSNLGYRCGDERLMRESVLLRIGKSRVEARSTSRDQNAWARMDTEVIQYVAGAPDWVNNNIDEIANVVARFSPTTANTIVDKMLPGFQDAVRYRIAVALIASGNATDARGFVEGIRDTKYTSAALAHLGAATLDATLQARSLAVARSVVGVNSDRVFPFIEIMRTTSDLSLLNEARERCFGGDIKDELEALSMLDRFVARHSTSSALECVQHWDEGVRAAALETLASTAGTVGELEYVHEVTQGLTSEQARDKILMAAVLRSIRDTQVRADAIVKVVDQLEAHSDEVDEIQRFRSWLADRWSTGQISAKHRL
jgi:hypothetical protein